MSNHFSVGMTRSRSCLMFIICATLKIDDCRCPVSFYYAPETNEKSNSNRNCHVSVSSVSLFLWKIFTSMSLLSGDVCMCTLFLAPWQQHDWTWSGENGRKIANKFLESENVLPSADLWVFLDCCGVECGLTSVTMFLLFSCPICLCILSEDESSL